MGTPSRRSDAGTGGAVRRAGRAAARVPPAAEPRTGGRPRRCRRPRRTRRGRGCRPTGRWCPRCCVTRGWSWGDHSTGRYRPALWSRCRCPSRWTSRRWPAGPDRRHAFVNNASFGAYATVVQSRGVPRRQAGHRARPAAGRRHSPRMNHPVMGEGTARGSREA
jgi:hypothetical protein